MKTGTPEAAAQTVPEQTMAKTPQTPAPQQQGGTTPAAGQMTGNATPSPQQGQQPVIRDWASF